MWLQRHVIDGFGLQDALPGVSRRSHAPIQAIMDHQFGESGIYLGEFGLMGELRGL